MLCSLLTIWKAIALTSSNSNSYVYMNRETRIPVAVSLIQPNTHYEFVTLKDPLYKDCFHKEDQTVIVDPLVNIDMSHYEHKHYEFNSNRKLLSIEPWFIFDTKAIHKNHKEGTKPKLEDFIPIQKDRCQKYSDERRQECEKEIDHINHKLKDILNKKSHPNVKKVDHKAVKKDHLNKKVALNEKSRSVPLNSSDRKELEDLGKWFVNCKVHRKC